MLFSSQQGPRSNDIFTVRPEFAVLLFDVVYHRCLPSFLYPSILWLALLPATLWRIRQSCRRSMVGVSHMCIPILANGGPDLHGLSSPIRIY